MINEKNSNNNINYMSLEELQTKEFTEEQILSFNPEIAGEDAFDIILDRFGHILAKEAVTGDEFLKIWDSEVENV